MSNFRDFLFNRDPSAAWALTLAMTGVRMGERQLLVGDDARAVRAARRRRWG